MKNIWWGLSCLCLLLLLTACNPTVASQAVPSHPLTGDALNHSSAPQSLAPTTTPMPAMSIPSQKLTPKPKAGQGASNSPAAGCVAFSHDTTRAPGKSGGLASPYGNPPTSSTGQTFASELFHLINNDRAACGLPAFTWSSTLADGALLHSWNMEHCGFSHTCPDGMSPCQRIANEGFPNATDCGECIGGAGGSWSSVSSIQEGMEHEPVTGWHRIHLFSTTLHTIGIGVYIDSSGYVWFTEDLVS